MTSPTSKRKHKLAGGRSAEARLKRFFERKMRKREPEPEPTMPHADAILQPPRVRLAGAEIESFQVACGDEFHPMHFIRKDHVLKAIITPCGHAAARAAYNLGAANCYHVIAIARAMLDDSTLRGRSGESRGSIDTMGALLRGIGDREALQVIKELKTARRVSHEIDAWDRARYTIPALAKWLAGLAGPGYEIAFYDRRCYIQAPGQELSSCYVWDTGSWSAGPGPQGSDHVYQMLRTYTPIIIKHMRLAQKRGIAMQTPGFRPF